MSAISREPRVRIARDFVCRHLPVCLRNEKISQFIDFQETIFLVPAWPKKKRHSSDFHGHL